MGKSLIGPLTPKGNENDVGVKRRNLRISCV